MTICVKDRKNIFGKIVDGKMRLSELGKIVQEEWLRTPIIRPNVGLDEFIIMPNHLHGIIEILYAMESDINYSDEFVGIDCNQSLRDSETVHKYGPQSNNLFAIIRGFKGAVTKRANELLGNIDGGSIWQSRFYDHIIRNEKELNNIRVYIFNNLRDWDLDLENIAFRSSLPQEQREKMLKKHYDELFGK